jgi:hypothetical protein
MDKKLASAPASPAPVPRQHLGRSCIDRATEQAIETALAAGKGIRKVERVRRWRLGGAAGQGRVKRRSELVGCAMNGRNLIPQTTAAVRLTGDQGASPSPSVLPR